jgi:translation initiation factor IF-3
LEASIATIDSIVQTEEVVQILEAAEVAGSVNQSQLLEVLEPHGLDLLEVEPSIGCSRSGGST